MADLDLTVLSTALPPGTSVVASTDGSSQLLVGTFFQTSTNAAPWVSDDGDTPEQAVARAFFFASLQQTMGAEAYAVGPLPTWTPGMALPEAAPQD